MRRALPLLLAALLPGCGVIAGTLVDITIDAVTYPVREFLFFGAYKYDNAWEEPWKEIPRQRDDGELLVGLCVSGGGSRSAYFLTCVLDELGKTKVPNGGKTWLEEVDYISAVSGGSLASAYYCLNRRREGFPRDHDAFFARMRADVSLDFETRSFGRIVLGWWFPLSATYYDRGDLVASVWDSNFLEEKTFADLPPEAPTLIVNASCYDTGQKFVFTTLPLAKIDGVPEFDALVKRRILTRGYGQRYVPFATMSLETLDSDVGRCPLSTAVAASASVPNLLGPVRLKDRKRDREIHLGDGGLYDNHGLETMVAVLSHRLREDPKARAVIIVVDGAGFFDTEGHSGDVTTVGDFFDRTLFISWLRTSVFAEAAYGKVQDESKRLDFAVVSLHDDEAIECCDSLRDRPIHVPGPDAIVAPVERLVDRLRAVGTRFSIDDEGVAAIELAAPRLVKAALERKR